MSSGNSLAFDKLSVRLFAYIGDRGKPTVKTWATRALLSAKEGTCPLSITLSFQFLKKLNKFKMLSDVQFCFSFKIMSSCHTLSNTLIIAIHLMIYGMFFIQRRTKHEDLYHLLLICHMEMLLEHIMLF